ncbi:MAG: flavodoxin domain-containing protein [Methanocellales archaeon]
MKAVKITEGIFWVGAIDWNIRDFHGYKTPRGTSYNAYLILDEKIALVDTVKHGFAGEMIARIKDVIDPARIDYVISNHVEMDHSGSLLDILKIAERAKVVCSAKGKEGLKKHYQREWDFQVVKTGDELKLGRKTLKFAEIPMLHWPDSMVSYLIEDQILLSSDAFGQHIATSKRFNDEVKDIDILEEAAKYYANILEPYSALIPKAVEKITALGIAPKIIAPSHGVIWRENALQIINAYLEWSKGVLRDRVVIVFDTMWQSTEKMAIAISEGIASEGVRTQLFHLRKSDWSEIVKEIKFSRVLLVGTPTINNAIYPSVAGFLEYIKGLRFKGKKASAFGSYGWSGEAPSAAIKRLEEAGFQTIEPLRLQWIPSESELKECFEFGRRIANQVKGKV